MAKTAKVCSNQQDVSTESIISITLRMRAKSESKQLLTGSFVFIYCTVNEFLHETNSNAVYKILLLQINYYV